MSSSLPQHFNRRFSISGASFLTQGGLVCEENDQVELNHWPSPLESGRSVFREGRPPVMTNIPKPSRNPDRRGKDPPIELSNVIRNLRRILGNETENDNGKKDAKARLTG
jgi:hypothetical protein